MPSQEYVFSFFKIQTWAQLGWRPLLLGTRTLLGAPGIATRSKDATRGSWPYYYVLGWKPSLRLLEALDCFVLPFLCPSHLQRRLAASSLPPMQRMRRSTGTSKPLELPGEVVAESANDSE